MRKVYNELLIFGNYVQFQGGIKVNEIKKDTFRSKSKRLCDNDDMVRVVLDMTRREYFIYLKPLLNSDYTKFPKVKEPELTTGLYYNTRILSRYFY